MIIIYKNGKRLTKTKNRKLASEAFKKLNVRGFNVKILRKNLKDESSFKKTVGSDTYIIEEIKENKKTVKKLKNMSSESKTFYNPKGRMNEITLTSNIKIPLIFGDSQDISHNLVLLDDTVKNELLRKNINLQRKKFQVQFVFDGLDGSDRIFSTVFSSYSDLIDNMYLQLVSYHDDYDDTSIVMDLSKIRIRYYDFEDMPDQLILASSKNQDELKDYYLYMLDGKQRETKLLTFIKKWKIDSVNTTKNCFLKAVLCCLYPKNKIKSPIRNIEKACDFSNHSRILKEQALTISAYFKVKIIVYHHDLEKFQTYGDNNNYDRVANILNIHGHAYYMTPRKSELNSTKFLKPFKEQQLMKVKTESKKHYEEVYYGAYDYETFNQESKESEKKQTIPFAIGFYDGLFKKYVEYFKTDSGVNVSFDFLCHYVRLSTKVDKKTKIIFYAHNGGKFDSYLLLEACLLKHVLSVKLEYALFSLKMAVFYPLSFKYQKIYSLSSVIPMRLFKVN
jgi:hypothetical protein